MRLPNPPKLNPVAVKSGLCRCKRSQFRRNRIAHHGPLVFQRLYDETKPDTPCERRGKVPRQIGSELRCSDQCVKEAIDAFHYEGFSCLVAKSNAPHIDQSAIDEKGRERKQEIFHHSPRHFGRYSNLWTLEGLAEVNCRQSETSAFFLLEEQAF